MARTAPQCRHFSDISVVRPSEPSPIVLGCAAKPLHGTRLASDWQTTGVVPPATALALPSTIVAAPATATMSFARRMSPNEHTCRRGASGATPPRRTRRRVWRTSRRLSSLLAINTSAEGPSPAPAANQIRHRCISQSYDPHDPSRSRSSRLRYPMRAEMRPAVASSWGVRCVIISSSVMAVAGAAMQIAATTSAASRTGAAIACTRRRALGR